MLPSIKEKDLVSAEDKAVQVVASIVLAVMGVVFVIADPDLDDDIPVHGVIFVIAGIISFFVSLVSCCIPTYKGKIEVDWEKPNARCPKCTKLCTLEVYNWKTNERTDYQYVVVSVRRRTTWQWVKRVYCRGCGHDCRADQYRNALNAYRASTQTSTVAEVVGETDPVAALPTEKRAPDEERTTLLETELTEVRPSSPSNLPMAEAEIV